MSEPWFASRPVVAYIEELEARLIAACEPCAECGHIDWRELHDIVGDPKDAQPWQAINERESVLSRRDYHETAHSHPRADERNPA